MLSLCLTILLSPPPLSFSSMAAEQALAQHLAAQYPDFYDHLMHLEIPADFAPDPAMTRTALATMTREVCRTCEHPGARLKCPVCGVARYCNVECQRLDETEHRQFCRLDGLLKGTMREQLQGGHVEN